MVNSNGNRQKRKRSDDRKHYSPFTIYHLLTKKRSTAVLLSSSPPVQPTCPFYDPDQKSSFAKLPSTWKAPEQDWKAPGQAPGH
jgi:hypothetical protein